MSDTVGFIGLGNMGLPMAKNLLAGGYQLKVYNRTREKADSLAAENAQIVNHPNEAIEPGGIVITMLANDAALEAVVCSDNGILASLGNDGIHLSMSTVSPTTAHKLAELHTQHGSHYVAAPVFGRPDAAAARKLWIALSGQLAVKERVKPILDQLGQGIFDFGEQ
ncbi:MAG TPA: NAD(P)-dependent oxidoreductase, partial [Microcoleaceae cyanobacterium]